MTQLLEAAGSGLDCALDGAVAVVRLNRPAARNALSSELVERLESRLFALDDDEAVRAIVLTGAPPGFCAGSDVRELAGMGVPEMARHEARTGQVVRSIQQLRTPVVAAVEGFALGGGFLLALGCDVVVTTAAARWHLPEVQLGWVPPWGLQSLVARGGPAVARRLAWGDQPLTGHDLHRLGVADELAETAGALSAALEIASRLALLPPNAVAATKRALTAATLSDAETLDTRTNWMFAQNCESDTARLSLDRFKAKSNKENR